MQINQQRTAESPVDLSMSHIISRDSADLPSCYAILKKNDTIFDLFYA